MFPGLNAAAVIAKNYLMLRFVLTRKEFHDLIEIIQLADKRGLLKSPRAEQLVVKLTKAYKLLHSK